MKRHNERDYIGNLAQLFEVKEYKMLGGRADGLRAVDIDNGAGLVATILADRGMDLGKVSFRGVNMSFISPCGYVAPQYYNPIDAHWLQSFTAGMMTTCGLSNIGSPCEDAGDTLGLHGRIANIPAEQFSAQVLDEGDAAKAVLHGVMRHATVFHENLLLTRDITVSQGENKIHVRDVIQNIGCEISPLMTLYHCNMGYPLLDENTEIWIPAEHTTARNQHAQEGFDQRLQSEAPCTGFEEMCFYHRMRRNADGQSGAGVFNPEKGVGLVIWFSADSLDHFTQWKMMGKRQYVLGLEPGNAWVDGRAAAREQGDLKFIAPGESIVNQLTFEFFDREDAGKIKAQLEALR